MPWNATNQHIKETHAPDYIDIELSTTEVRLQDLMKINSTLI